MKAKLVTFAALTLAGLGAMAGRHNPTAERCSSPGSEPPAAVNRISPAPAPVETPLVEKLLPKSPQVSAPLQKSPQLTDGQLSPRGEWQWSEAQWAWVPVKKPGPAWVQDGHSATVDHLVREHGYSRASLENLTQSQLDVLYSNAHNAARAAAPVRSSGCPGGVCPSPSRGGFRLFRR